MRKILCWWLVSAAVAAHAMGAVTVLRQEVTVHIRDAKTFDQTVRLHLRVDEARDLAGASAHVIPLDASEILVRVDAHSLAPNGKRSDVGRRQRDSAELTLGSGTFHDGRRFEILEFDALEVGSEIHIAYEIEASPYFPASAIALRTTEPIGDLEIVLRSDISTWRYRIFGPVDDLEITEDADGLTIRGSDIEAAEKVDWAPGGPERLGVLHFAWDTAGDWAGVGTWYRDLLDDVPHQHETVRLKARELIDGVSDPRRRLEILLAFLRRQVRYVAVEIGIGGYRPSAPREVLERRWGDCKDKSMLLIDLLREAGIPAYPALIRADTESRIVEGFATPLQFNHLIVAVPRAAVAVMANDPVASGYLWLDPTQSRGGAGWLNSWVQDQHALVVEPSGARLVATPSPHDVEGRALTVDLALSADGRATGEAHMTVQGARAVALIEQSESETAEATESTIRAIFRGAFRGAEIARPTWRTADDDIPKIELRAAIDLPGFIERPDSPSLHLGGLSQLPSAGDFRERDTPAILRPGIAHTVWRLRLPPGDCLPEASSLEVVNDLGSFRQTVTVDAATRAVLIDRRTELARRWIAAENMEALRQLALAENRAQKRRLRFQCDATPAP